MEKALQELLDKQAITEVLNRYSRTLDWLDDEGHARCYWSDAEVDYGFFVGRADEFVPVVMEVERASKRRWHMLNSVQILFRNETKADVECYGLAVGINDSEGEMKGNLYGGRYLDKFEKREAESGREWRISRRKYILDWTLPLPAQPDGSPRAEFPLHMLDLTQSGHKEYRSI